MTRGPSNRQKYIRICQYGYCPSILLVKLIEFQVAELITRRGVYNILAFSAAKRLRSTTHTVRKLGTTPYINLL